MIHWDLERWKVKLIDFNGLDEEMEDLGFGLDLAFGKLLGYKLARVRG